MVNREEKVLNIACWRIKDKKNAEIFDNLTLLAKGGIARIDKEDVKAFTFMQSPVMEIKILKKVYNIIIYIFGRLRSFRKRKKNIVNIIINFEIYFYGFQIWNSKALRSYKLGVMFSH